MSKKLVLNSISGTFLYAINIIVAFIMSPVLIRALGNRDYGLWELVMSVIGYMGLLDLGIGPSLVRFISVADGNNDRKDLHQTMSTAFVFFVIVGMLAMGFLFSLSVYPQFIAGNEIKDVANLGSVFLLLGIDAGLLFPLQVYVAVLMGLQRHYFINGARGVLAVVRAVIALRLLQIYPGSGLVILALLEPIFTLVQFVLFSGALWMDKSVPRIAFSAVSMGKMKELFTYGLKSVAMLAASRIQNMSIPIIISKCIGLGSIVYFVVPNRLIDYAKGFSIAIGFPLTPYFGASIGKGDLDALRTSWIATTRVLLIFSLPMPLIILFCGESFLSLWIGTEYAIAGRPVMYILLLGLLFEALSPTAMRILLAMALHGKSAVVWLVLSVASIPLGVAGAYWGGVAGVALGTTSVTVLGNLITLSLACTVMRVSYTEYFKETLVHVLLPLLLLAISLWFMVTIVTSLTYAAMILQLTVSLGVYGVSIWVFTLSSDVRELVRRKIVSSCM